MPQLTTSRVPVGFAEATAPANGITMNYVRGGTGPTLVLLHGYPQTWYMWRKVLPAVAEHFTVIAPDLRGAGGSDAPTDGYTKSSLAKDTHDLLVGLGLADQVSYKQATARALSNSRGSLYVAIHDIVAMAEAFLPAGDKTAWDSDVKPYAAPFQAL